MNLVHQNITEKNTPPNAPDTVAAEKKRAARIPNSERLYQLKMML